MGVGGPYSRLAANHWGRVRALPEVLIVELSAVLNWDRVHHARSALRRIWGYITAGLLPLLPHLWELYTQSNPEETQAGAEP